MKRMALSHPLSAEVSLRSHCAEGRRKEMQRISMASEALAQPQTSRKSQWNLP